MTEEEAKREAFKKNDLTAKIQGSFCPLIKDSCNRTCVCWEEYRAYSDIENKNWYITGGSCDCYMLVGGGG